MKLQDIYDDKINNLVKVKQLSQLLENIVNEALPLKTAKKYREQWDLNTYADIFKNFPTEKDKNAFRLYFPLSNDDSAQAVSIPQDINKHVSDKGYDITDDVSGYATSKLYKNRQMKIGKILSDTPQLQQKFNQDKQRQGSKKQNLMVAISRHPYDIAGMSTDRGWTSCMSLTDGSSKRYVLQDIKQGTIIAYLIEANDKNIKHPIGRKLIKPFISDKNKKDIILVPETEAYGYTNVQFDNIVDEFCENINQGKEYGLYCMNKKLYTDGENEATRNPAIPNEIIAYINNLSVDQLMGLYDTFGIKVFKYLKNPSVKLLSELYRDYDISNEIFKYIDVSEETLLSLFKDDALYTNNILKYLKNPSEKIIKLAINDSVSNIQYVPNSSKELQLYAVRMRVFALEHIRNPYDETILYAYKKLGNDLDDLLGYIPENKINNNLKMQFIKNDPENIGIFENPTDEMIQLALKLNISVISQDIKNMSEASALFFISLLNSYEFSKVKKYITLFLEDGITYNSSKIKNELNKYLNKYGLILNKNNEIVKIKK